MIGLSYMATERSVVVSDTHGDWVNVRSLVGWWFGRSLASTIFACIFGCLLYLCTVWVCACICGGICFRYASHSVYSNVLTYIQCLNTICKATKQKKNTEWFSPNDFSSISLGQPVYGNFIFSHFAISACCCCGRLLKYVGVNSQYMYSNGTSRSSRVSSSIVFFSCIQCDTVRSN